MPVYVFYALKEAVTAIRRAKLTSFAATATMTVFMFLLGLFLLAYANLNNLAANIRERVQIEAFLSNDLDGKGSQGLADSIKTLSSVQAVSYVDKEMALDIFRQQFGEEALQALETNPLPASLIIELREGDRTYSRVEQIAGQIAELPGVEDVEYGRAWLSRLENLISLAGAITLILGFILAISAVTVVSTTINLAFHMRREAVDIMRLVGAAPGFISQPFLVEGAIYGLLGSLFGIVLLSLLYSVLSRHLAGLSFLSAALLFGLLAFGAALGGLGSALSSLRTRLR
jgi:cell division transport system permease protein